MACLDTSFIIDLLKGKRDVLPILEELEQTEKIISIAAPSVMELWTGIALSKNSEEEKRKVEELLKSFNILPLEEESAKGAGEIEADLIKRGMPIESEDIMIAAIAKVNGEKVVTADEHFSRIAGLKVYKY